MDNRDGEGRSPSLRGSGLKYKTQFLFGNNTSVALFTRAWIEIFLEFPFYPTCKTVALFTRAWIEIYSVMGNLYCNISRPLYEGVD